MRYDVQFRRIIVFLGKLVSRGSHTELASSFSHPDDGLISLQSAISYTNSLLHYHLFCCFGSSFFLLLMMIFRRNFVELSPRFPLPVVPIRSIPYTFVLGGAAASSPRDQEETVLSLGPCEVRRYPPYRTMGAERAV